MACQFLEAARKDLPDLDSSLEGGNFEPLKSWLNREVCEDMLRRERRRLGCWC